MLELPPLSLYLHIPWCVRKCPYCDFNSHQSDSELPESDYVKAILEDLRRSLPLVQGRRLQSIFIGGGTPSLFQPDAFDTLLRAFEKQIGFEPDIEITMEANPGTFEQRRFLGYRSAGINRLSIGIQSFSDLHLQQLGRIHGRQEALCAVAMARQAGFNNINLDLMHGLPGQTPADAAQDLSTAMDLGPEHLSWYQLTIEPNTEFYSRPPILPEDDALADIQQMGEALLYEGGYRQYEVSAYASRPEHRSRHNLNYWTFGDYLGLGAGAHGKITLPDQGHILRFNKTRLPRHYLEHMAEQGGSADGGAKTIEQDDLALEYMMNCLRLVEGTDLNLFEPRTGLTLAKIASRLKNLQDQGLISTEHDLLRTTESGQRYLNQVLESFVST